MKRTSLLISAVLCLALLHPARFADATEITLRFAGFDSPEWQQSMEGKFRAFEAKNPGIKVGYEIVQGYDYGGEILKTLAAGTAQDGFLVWSLIAKTFMKRDLLLPLGKYLKRGVTRATDFLPALIEGFSYKGEVYGLPISFDTLALFYNTEMFDAAGLAYPNPNWTWDDLRSAAKRLTKPSTDPAENQYGISLGLSPFAIMAFILQAGGSLLSSKDEPILQVEPTARALDYLASFYKDGSALPSGLEGLGWEEGGPFASHRVAMVIERAGMLSNILKARASDLLYGVTELPKGPKGRGNLYDAYAYSANSKTRYPEEAWEFMEFLSSPEVQLSEVEAGSGLPTRVALRGVESIARRPEVSAMFGGLAYARSDYLGEHYEQTWNLVWEAFWGVLKGWTTAKEAATQAVADLARIGK